MANKVLMRKLYKGAVLTDLQIADDNLQKMLEIETPKQCLKIAEALRRLGNVRRLVQGKPARETEP